jgi:hypothetical protein
MSCVSNQKAHLLPYYQKKFMPSPKINANPLNLTILQVGISPENMGKLPLTLLLVLRLGNG